MLAEHGAEKIYQLDDAAYTDFLVAPKAEAIAKIAARLVAGGRAAVLER